MGKLRLLMSEEVTRRRRYYGEGYPGYMLGWRDRDCVGIRVKSNAPTFIPITHIFDDDLLNFSTAVSLVLGLFYPVPCAGSSALLWPL